MIAARALCDAQSREAGAQRIATLADEAKSGSLTAWRRIHSGLYREYGMSRNLPVSTNDLHVSSVPPSAAAAYIRLLHESLTQELARIRLDIMTLQGDKSVKGISTLNKGDAEPRLQQPITAHRKYRHT
ncbi:MAG: hypothetical protein IPO61_07325 [Gammaproteobacteria bacterium]|nr:hypothetical protein [Gammaproteobacteria bacterium]